MRRLIAGIVCAAALLVSALSAHARSEASPEVLRPVMSFFTYGVGTAHDAETYLSPLHYDGWTMELGYGRAQAMKGAPERLTMELDVNFRLDRTLNAPARNSLEWRLSGQFRWGMMRKWTDVTPWKLTLMAGAYAGIEGGMFYLPRNGNNPVAAKASLVIGPRVAALRTIRIGRLPVRFQYRAEMPLTGIFFSPDYGELYYEIYLGNHSGLVRGAWPGNYFTYDHTLMADLVLGATTLRLGYHGVIHSSKASDIVTRAISHAFVLGVVTEWVSLDPRRRPENAPRILNAY